MSSSRRQGYYDPWRADAIARRELIGRSDAVVAWFECLPIGWAENERHVMSIEAIIIVGAIVVCVVLGTWSALVTRDSWDRKPAEGEDDFDYHKATLGIHQPPGEEHWEKELDALRMDQKHRLC